MISVCRATRNVPPAAGAPVGAGEVAAARAAVGTAATMSIARAPHAASPSPAINRIDKILQLLPVGKMRFMGFSLLKK
jgi:hypothetical protein